MSLIGPGDGSYFRGCCISLAVFVLASLLILYKSITDGQGSIQKRHAYATCFNATLIKDVSVEVGYLSSGSELSSSILHV